MQVPALVVELHLEFGVEQGLVVGLQGLPARPSEGAATETNQYQPPSRHHDEVMLNVLRCQLTY